MRVHILAVRYLVLASVLASCGDSGTGPETTYNDISGSYSGQMAGTAQGITLQGVFSLTIAQDRGGLSGTWATTGTLTDGVDVVPVQGTGTITGTIAAGNNPSVNVSVRNPGCPNISEQFSGTYDTTNRRLTLFGPVYILNPSNCAILLTYQFTIVLSR